MLFSKFLGLKKPELDDFYNIEDFNFNTDLIDETLEELSKNKINLGQAKVFDESYSVDETFFKAVMDDFFERFNNLQGCNLYSVEYAIQGISWFVFLINVNECGESHSADVLIYNRNNFFKYYYNTSNSVYMTQRIDNSEIVADLTAEDNTKFRFATDGEGNYGFLKADDSFIPFKKGGNVTIDGVPFEGDELNLVSKFMIEKKSISILPYNFIYGSAVVLNNEIHILGSSETPRNHCKWNGSSWYSANGLPYDFYHGSAVVLNNEIHILGGYNSNKHYKWNGSSWVSVSTLPFYFSVGSAVVLNNEIHILGGGNGNSTKHYKWNGSSWVSVSTLPYDFAYSSAIVLNNEIHILGSSYSSYVKNHYKFDGTSWTSVSTLPYVFNQGSAVLINNQIHILGTSGNSGDKIYNSYKKNHFKFDGTSWTSVSTLPYDFSQGSAVLLNNQIHVLGSISAPTYHYYIGKNIYNIA